MSAQRPQLESPSDPHAGQPILTAGPAPAQAGATLLLVHGRGATAWDILSLRSALAVEGLVADVSVRETVDHPAQIGGAPCIRGLRIPVATAVGLVAEELSSQGWHEGRHNPWTFINYVLWVLKEAYNDFEQRVGDTAEPFGGKVELVRQAVYRQQGSFRVSDLERACP